jgi:hypothetical protein
MFPGIGPENDTAGFLADIVIKLTRDTGQGYLQTSLEISKSRVCRQALGKHLYKTRTMENAERVGISKRAGLVIYPSVHFIVSQARQDIKRERFGPFVIADGLKELLSPGSDALTQRGIEPPACFALEGPAGTHKLALGLNLGFSYVGNKAKLLVVTFGGQGDIDFKGVAWEESQQYLKGLAKNDKEKPAGNWTTKEPGTKEKIGEYIAHDNKSEKNAEVCVLTFQIGVLTPEECIHRIRKVLEWEENEGRPFHSVLLSDTAELCTGFPLLSKDPMFFAALLDLFQTHGLLTVGLGVHSSDTPSLRDLNLTLMAKATHRLVFSQFPRVEDLMRDMVKMKHKEMLHPEISKIENGMKRVEEGTCWLADTGVALGPVLDEQLVSVVIDNVTGKHYKRQPKWIWVEQNPVNGRKVLHCEPFEKPNISLDSGVKESNGKPR